MVENPIVFEIVLPRDLRGEFLESTHRGTTAGHLGPRRMKSQVQLRAFWPGWADDITRTVRQCDLCAQYCRVQRIEADNVFVRDHRVGEVTCTYVQASDTKHQSTDDSPNERDSGAPKWSSEDRRQSETFQYLQRPISFSSVEGMQRRRIQED